MGAIWDEESSYLFGEGVECTGLPPLGAVQENIKDALINLVVLEWIEFVSLKTTTTPAAMTTSVNALS